MVLEKAQKMNGRDGAQEIDGAFIASSSVKRSVSQAKDSTGESVEQPGRG